MRPIYWCSENFRESLSTPTATIPEIFWWAFVPIDPVNVRIKSEVRTFTRSWDNSRYFKTLDSPWIRLRSLFSKIFNGLLFGWTLRQWMYRPNLKSVALPVSEITGVLKNVGQSLEGLDTPFKVNQGRWFWYQSKARMNFLLVRNSNLDPILHRFGDITGFLCSWVTPPIFHASCRGVPVAPDHPCWGQPAHKP